MDVEKIEILGFDVSNLEEAIKKFSDILGTTFHTFDGAAMDTQRTLTTHAQDSYENASARAAIDRRGFIELVEAAPPVAKDSVRNIHFKVPNLEDAVAEMTLKGYRMVTNVRIGNLKEAVFHPDDVCGIRLCFVEYDEPTLVDAMLAGGREQQQ